MASHSMTGRTNIVAWLHDSLDLAGEGDPTFEAVHAEMKRRGLKLY